VEKGKRRCKQAVSEGVKPEEVREGAKEGKLATLPLLLVSAAKSTQKHS
jgi:hypothetical protein